MPEATFEKRKEQFEIIRDQLGPNPRSEDNEDRLRELCESGALPWNRTSSTPSEWSNKHGLSGNYFLQLFFSTANEIVDEDLSKSEVQERLEQEKDREMPNNMPSDGSKGQWRAGKKHRIASYNWFLKGEV